VALITVHALANTGRTHAYVVFNRLKPYFNIAALIFSGRRIKPTHSQPTEHAKNYGIDILTMEATIFDTLGT